MLLQLRALLRGKVGFNIRACLESSTSRPPTSFPLQLAYSHSLAKMPSSSLFLGSSTTLISLLSLVAAPIAAKPFTPAPDTTYEGVGAGWNIWSTSTKPADPTWTDWSSIKTDDPWTDWKSVSTKPADPWTGRKSTTTKSSDPWSDWKSTSAKPADPWTDWKSTSVKPADPWADWKSTTTKSADPWTVSKHNLMQARC